MKDSVIIRCCFTDSVNAEVVKKANPNRHGIVALIKTTHKVSGVLIWWTVEEGEDGGDWQIDDWENEAQAQTRYERLVNELADTPNWEAQAEYDEAHGTINGRDPGVVMYEEMFPYGD